MDKQHGPWIIHESTVKYKNPWMEVREDAVIRPDGSTGIHSVADLHPGVSVLPLDDDGFVYVVKEFAYAIGRWECGTANGFMDVGETPLDAAKRELKEELGITAGDWIDLGLVNPMTSSLYAPAHLYFGAKTYVWR